MNFARLLAIATAAPLSLALAAPGDRDPSFGANGYVDVRIGESEDSAQALLRRADGTLVAVGRSGDDAALARYLPDGALDPAFGNGGRVLLRLRGTNLDPFAAAEQADGRIVVVAAALAGAKVLRFNADGSLDGSFDHSALELPSGVSIRRAASAVAVQPDGRILVSVGGPGTFFGAARLLPGGAIDPSFGSGGVALADAGSTVFPAGLLLQPDGRVVVAASDYTPTPPRIFAARFNADGSRDVGFSFPVTQGQVGALALQPDGKILLAGCVRFDTFTYPFLAVWRTQPDGAIDTSFGTGGRASFTPEQCATGVAVAPDGRIGLSALTSSGFPGTRSYVGVLEANGQRSAAFGSEGLRIFLYDPASANNANSANAIVALPDGKLVVAGDRGLRDFALERYAADGPDAAFGTNGRIATELMGGMRAEVRDIQQANGKLVVLAGLLPDSYPDNPPRPYRTALARFLADGTPDSTFGNGGQVMLSETPAGFLALPDDRILLYTHVPDLPQKTLVTRLQANGAPDPSFGTSGTASMFFAVTAMRAQPDGRIVMAGVQSATTPVPLRIARRLPDGSPDPSFGNGGEVARPRYSTTSGPGAGNLLVQSDGKILVGDSADAPFSVIRLNPDGSSDPTFGTGGAASYPIPGGATSQHVASLVAHADGRLTLAGHEDVAPQLCAFGVPRTVPAFGRWGPSGGSTSLPPDADIGVPGLGYLTGRLDPGMHLRIHAAALDGQDRLVAAGTRHVTCVMGAMLGDVYSRRRPVAFRFTPSGALDTRFGNGGFVQLESAPDSASWQTIGTDVVTQPSGRAVVAVTTAGSRTYAITLHGLQGGGDSAPIGPPGDIDADGIPNSVEGPEARDPFVRDNDVFTSARLFVMQQYRDFLGREGDPAGITSWTNFMGGGENRATLADSFLRSPEFEGTVAPVTRLYFAYFLRIPDYGGLNYWMGRFRSGESLEGISTLFANSPEFVATYGALDNAGFVDRVYRNVLGRAPDAGGLAFWSGRLDAGMTRGQMMVQFSESPEYRALIANEVYVTMVYVGMLRRAPDAGGFSYWVSYMDAGNPGLALTGAFIAAPEYRARFVP